MLLDIHKLIYFILSIHMGQAHLAMASSSHYWIRNILKANNESALSELKCEMDFFAIIWPNDFIIIPLSFLHKKDAVDTVILSYHD